jgi:uncharacterized protein (DUF58 family)
VTAPVRWRGFAQLATDLQRLNHILIPQTKEARDRFRNSRTARALMWAAFFVGRFTEDGQMLAVFAAIALAFAIDVRRSDVYLAWAALTGVLVASAAGAIFFRLRGLRVDVLLPRRVTVHEEATFLVAARNEGPVDHDTIVVRGAFLPWDGSWTVGRAEVPRLRRGEEARVALRARFSSRGDHHLDPIRLQVLVPFGLSLGPALETEGVRFLAVPRIANVVSLPQAIASRRHQSGGVPRALHLADSRELVGVRPYRFGDSVRDLHARSWARLGEPVVREYREEFFARIAIVLDTDVGDAPDDDFEAAISLVAGIADRLARTEALVDVVVLGGIAHPLTIGHGLGTIDRVLELLARVEPEGAFDANAVGAALFPRLPSVASVFVVSLRWDAPRAALAAAIRTRGTACLPIVVGPTERNGAGGAIDEAARVAPELVRSGREVAL